MHIYSVLIIGGGPAGLALAARLHEHTPSATFTDDEHQRYHWLRKHGARIPIKNYRTNVDSLPTPPSTLGSSDCGCDTKAKSGLNEIDMLVLDADGEDWMTRWKRLFTCFGITHLRSPMFFHIDPADRDGLLRYTYERGREGDLLALPGCAGKEVSKHHKKKKMGRVRAKVSQSGPDVDERDRKDYFTPVTDLFERHCESVVERYGLKKGILRQERVVGIEYDWLGVFREEEGGSDDGGEDEEDERKVFRVTTDKGVRYAHVVVLAIGPGNAPTIPQVIGLPTPSSSHEGYSHAMHLKRFPPPHVEAKIRNHAPTNILIVGGGLTSIQLADLAIKRGVSKVWLLMRGSVKVKYFDIDLDWVGKFRNFNQAAFWSADSDEERLQMYLHARNGGSITPRYRKILNEHVATGKISLHTHMTLYSVQYDTDTQTWVPVTTTPPISLSPIDFIVFATGVQSDIEKLSFLDHIRDKYPIEYVGGLPCLNDDLMWNDEVPLFFNGRFAGLRLGPGAPNLVGCRIGAERIAWNVKDALNRVSRGDSEVENGAPDDDKLTEFAAGRRNRFDSLVEVSDP
ncbi:FAD/NAD(P)-binding domain-containing protein [Lentithecium fluviatile CBS 122367]|uniref:FAD/NAD(P)-binding domain-containing protein n=1 Tax=Lentithecium fluviatile CBS 122367 TaxID=1168545 RepID=A0A6G1IWW5_9PLEO|nr:FAD/NAD(P)-binding domain-containing protein [Lentithecium fluviatile CBS 122367]